MTSYRQPPEKLLLTLGEAAQRLGIGKETLKALIQDGTIYAIRIGVTSDRVKIPVAEITKFAEGGYASHRPR